MDIIRVQAKSHLANRGRILFSQLYMRIIMDVVEQVA